jgi:hypothetical protein
VAARKENGAFSVHAHLFGGWVLLDRRFNRPLRHLVLSEPQVALLLACDVPASRSRTLARAADAMDGSAREGLEECLSVLEEHEAIAAVGDLLVTLPLLPPGLRAGNLSRA